MAPITEPPPAARVCAVVVNYRTPELALTCWRALRVARDCLPGLEVMLVDGGSGDGSAARLTEALAAEPDPGTELVCLPINGGFAYANNQALLRLARRPTPPTYVCLVNPDAVPAPDALARLAALLDREPAAAVAGALLQDMAGQPQGSAFTFPTIAGEFCRGANTDVLRRLLRQPLPVVAPAAAAPVPWVTGAAAMLRWRALAAAGLFDTGFFLYFEEVELMHRLRAAGWQVWHEPLARVAHDAGSATQVRWDEAGYHRRARLPRYWYLARRRYFARTAGRPAALAAGLAFLLGRGVWHLRRLTGKRFAAVPLRYGRDMLRFSTWPSADDGADRIARLGDAPDRPPGWVAFAPASRPSQAIGS